MYDAEPCECEEDELLQILVTTTFSATYILEHLSSVPCYFGAIQESSGLLRVLREFF